MTIQQYRDAARSLKAFSKDMRDIRMNAGICTFEERLDDLPNKVNDNMLKDIAYLMLSGSPCSPLSVRINTPGGDVSTMKEQAANKRMKM